MIQQLLFLCLLLGQDTCQYIPDAHITIYDPALGGGNCEEPCDLTAFMTPLDYSTGAACGPDIPYGTQVYIDGVGWRTCNDRGGAIENDEVDILAPVPEGYWMTGYRDTIWFIGGYDDQLVSGIREAQGDSLGHQRASREISGVCKEAARAARH